jgi:hypothetical protein
MLQFRPNRLCRVELAYSKQRFFLLSRTYAYCLKYTVYLATPQHELIILHCDIVALHHNVFILHYNLILDIGIIVGYSKPISPLPQA